jgi:hypothetical protein
MKKVAAAIGALLFMAVPLRADAPFTNHVNSSNVSSTITGGGTYQSIYSQTLSRAGCTVQNNGTHTMWVFFGPIASATHGNSVQLSAGQALNCNVGNTILIDQISIDGTTADAFYAGAW